MHRIYINHRMQGMWRRKITNIYKGLTNSRPTVRKLGDAGAAAAFV